MLFLSDEFIVTFFLCITLMCRSYLSNSAITMATNQFPNSIFNSFISEYSILFRLNFHQPCHFYAEG